MSSRKELTCAFAPDGRSFVVADNGVSVGPHGTLSIWDVATGKCTRVLDGHPSDAGADKGKRTFNHPGGLLTCAYSPDGRHVLAGGMDKKLRLWDVTTGECTRVFEGHTGIITSCAFAAKRLELPSPKFNIASAGTDGMLRLWDSDTDENQSVEHSGMVTSCAFSPDGRSIATGTYDQIISIWNVPMKLLDHQPYSDRDFASRSSFITGHAREGAGAITSCTFSPDGRSLLFASSNGTLRLWDMTGAGCQSSYVMRSSEAIEQCAFSPNGKSIVSAHRDHALRIWNAETGQCMRLLTGHTDLVTSCAFAPDSKSIVSTIISASADATVYLWDAETGECQKTINHRSSVDSEDDHSTDIWGDDAAPGM